MSVFEMTREDLSALLLENGWTFQPDTRSWHKDEGVLVEESIVDLINYHRWIVPFLRREICNGSIGVTVTIVPSIDGAGIIARARWLRPRKK